MYLAIKKSMNLLLLLPIAFGALVTNLPLAGLMDGPTTVNGQFQPGGLLYYLYQEWNWESTPLHLLGSGR